MVQSLKRFLSDKIAPEEEDEFDLLERGLASVYNPNLIKASQTVPNKHGFSENFIRRDKLTMTFIMYEQQNQAQRAYIGHNKPLKTQKALLKNSVEVMRARYKPELKEFWIFNARVPEHMLDNESNVMAKLYQNESNNFVLKCRYCAHCSQKSHYYCSELLSQALPFQ